MLASTYDLIAITESGLNDSIQDGELIPPGYHIMRCDRVDGRKQGGVFIAASTRFKLSQVHIDNINTACFEVVCATVSQKNKILFLCCVVYIPPNSNYDQYMQLFQILENVCVKYESVIVCAN